MEPWKWLAVCCLMLLKRKGNTGCRHSGGLHRTPFTKINYLQVLSNPRLSASSARVLGVGEYMSTKLQSVFSYPRLSQMTLKSWATLDWDAPAVLWCNASRLAHFPGLEGGRSFSTNGNVSHSLPTSSALMEAAQAVVNFVDTQRRCVNKTKKENIWKEKLLWRAMMSLHDTKEQNLSQNANFSK